MADETDNSVFNVEDLSNNADQVSGLGRPDKAFFGQDQNNNSSAFMVPVTGQEEGDDYESDFDNEP